MSKSLAGIIYLTICNIRTFFIVPSARIIRFPIDIRGKKFIDFGRKLTTGYNCRLEAYPIENNNSKILKIGDNVQINDFVHIATAKNVEIGKGSIIGANSLVTKSIPDFSIAAGNPAKVIKQYNFTKKQWEKI